MAVIPAAAAVGEVGQVMLMVGVRKAPCPMFTPPDVPPLPLPLLPAGFHPVTMLKSRRGSTRVTGAGRVFRGGDGEGVEPAAAAAGLGAATAAAPTASVTVRVSMGRDGSMSLEVVGLGATAR